MFDTTAFLSNVGGVKQQQPTSDVHACCVDASPAEGLLPFFFGWVNLSRYVDSLTSASHTLTSPNPHRMKVPTNPKKPTSSSGRTSTSVSSSAAAEHHAAPRPHNLASQRWPYSPKSMRLCASATYVYLASEHAKKCLP